jgi:hypothetical protein
MSVLRTVCVAGLSALAACVSNPTMQRVQPRVDGPQVRSLAFSEVLEELRSATLSVAPPLSANFDGDRNDYERAFRLAFMYAMIGVTYSCTRDDGSASSVGWRDGTSAGKEAFIRLEQCFGGSNNP